MRGRTTATLALLLALAGCAGTDEPDRPTTRATTEPTEHTRPSPTDEPADLPSGGPVDDPADAEPATAPLDWQDTGVEAGTRYVKGPDWEALGDAGDTHGRARRATARP